jgi:hypothetical protein
VLDNKPGLLKIQATKLRLKGDPYAIEMLFTP